MPSPFYASGHGFHSVQVFENAAALRRDSLAYLEKHAEALRQRGLEVASMVAEGFGSDEIIVLARDTPDCLIAMSSHGRSGPGRWLLGSVAENVARHAIRPVLILRPS
jgi:nucleotide-binding universal stress UspA family protein